MSGGVVLTCDDRHTIHTPGDVVFEDDTIVYVGPGFNGEVDREVDAAGKLLLPGFINAHTHSSMTLFRGLSDDVNLQVFLEQRVWPREVKLTPDDVYAGSVLANIEMLKAGVTTYVDMYFYETALAQAALDVGMRGFITPAIIQSPAWEPILGTWDQRTQQVVDWCGQWEGRQGRIHTGLGPHSPYTLPLEGIREIGSQAREAGLPINIHLLETRGERDRFEAQHGARMPLVLQEIGLFDGPVISAHSVWLDVRDIHVYAERGVGVAHCPQSNCKLGSGVAPVAAMLKGGVQVGLGTDGAATNNNLDLWEELRLAPLLANVSALQPAEIDARAALWMATSMAARAIHCPDIGVLRPGAMADLLLVDLDERAVPIFGPESYIGHVVYAMGRDCVNSVWVNGNQVVERGQVLTVDEEKARAAAQTAAVALSQRARL